MKRVVHCLMAVVGLLLTVLAPVPTATAQGVGGCAETSTPGIVVTGEHHGDALQLTLTAQTTKSGVAHGNLVFRGAGTSVNGLEVHRVFLREDHRGYGAGIRGKGYLEDGSIVRVHVDAADRGDEGDRIRVRWRTYHSEHEAEDAALAAEHDCAATWLYDSGWIPVKHVRVHQR